MFTQMPCSCNLQCRQSTSGGPGWVTVHPTINQPTPSKIPLEEIQHWYTSTTTSQHLNAICLTTVKPLVMHEYLLFM